MVKISDPHGLHDWSSKEYVHDWATRQDRYEDERRPQFQMIADAIPFSTDASIQILDVGAGYGALTQFLLQQFPNATPSARMARKRWPNSVAGAWPNGKAGLIM